MSEPVLPKVVCPNCKRRWLLSGWMIGKIWCKTCKREVDVNHFDEGAIKEYIQKQKQAA